MTFSLTIDKLVLGGQGLGRRADGKVVLVPGVLPGEEVVAAPVEDKKSFVQARLLEVVSPSPWRVTPPCPHYGRCGGCDFQHVHPARQAELKDRMLREQLERSGFFPRLSLLLEPPVPSPASFRYRQRIRLHLDQNGRPGFLRQQSHQVEPVAHCLLARPELNDVLSCLVAWPLLRKIAPVIAELELLFSPEDGKVVLLLHLTRTLRPAEKKVTRAMVGLHASIKHVLVFAAGHGLVDSFCGDEEGRTQPLLLFSHAVPGGTQRMTVEPGGFCQVNPAQNEQLIALLCDWARIDGNSRVLDLFCGMGNFSLPLALRAGSVTGMDLQRSAIRSAVRNAAANGIDNCAFAQNSALEGAGQLVAAGARFDLILLDPPRQGCAEIIPLLPALAAGQIVYISCDPATLCRDLLLLEKEGYEVETMRMVDMFPQTHHLETIVSLRLSRPL